ncbi:MAG TPA: hypothetical protein VG844_13035 [Terracidiphilus sp.]|jgi:hypothetical protein|nr:hypothetical protein [Terracidiphilus sp.]
MDTQRDTYRAAYDDAAEEMKAIQREFERLSLRREKIAKVIEALEPRLGLENNSEVNGLTLTSQIDDTTFVTSISVAYTSKKRR